MTKQTQITKNAKAYCKQLNCVVYTTPNTPNLLICYNGIFIGAQAKKPGTVLSTKQQKELDVIAQAGGYSFLFVNIDQFKDKMERIIHAVDKSDRHREIPAV